jgi:hypothetical protein
MRALAGYPLLILALASVTAFAAACAGPTPSLVTFGAGEADTSSQSDSSNTKSGTSPSSNAANPTSGTTNTQSDTIFGTSAFAAGSPTGGPAKGRSDHSVINAQNDPSGHDCMACHASTFAFAGTLYADSNGSAGVAGAEIRVVGPDGQTFASAFSDADGNFWIASTGTVMPTGSHVGVRNGSKEMTMSGTIGGAGGNGCNATGTCHGNPSNRVALQ